MNFQIDIYVKTLNLFGLSKGIDCMTIHKNPLYKILTDASLTSSQRADALATAFNDAPSPEARARNEAAFAGLQGYVQQGMISAIQTCSHILEDSHVFSAAGTLIKRLDGALKSPVPREKSNALHKSFSADIEAAISALETKGKVIDGALESATTLVEAGYIVEDAAGKCATLPASLSPDKLRGFMIHAPNQPAKTFEAHVQDVFKERITQMESLAAMHRQQQPALLSLIRQLESYRTFFKDLDDNGLATTRRLKARKKARFSPGKL